MVRFDLILHPVRMRICQALQGRTLTTQALYQVLGDVPKPSLYRHLKLLLEGSVIRVVETHHIHGIEEKAYSANQEALLLSASKDRVYRPSEVAAFARLYATIAANELADFIERMEQYDSNKIAFRDYAFYATDEEYLAFRQKLWEMLQSLEDHSAEGRILRRLMVVSHAIGEDRRISINQPVQSSKSQRSDEDNHDSES